MRQSDLTDLEAAVDAAVDGFEDWSQTTPQQRSVALLKLADAIEANLDEFTALETFDIGKPRGQARGGAEESVDIIRFFAGAARCLDSVAAGDYRTGATSMVRLEPLGVVGIIIPWNYPAVIAAFKIAAAVGAGNTVVFKPSEVAPLTSLRIAELAAEIFPPGVINIITGGGSIGAAIAEHPKISMISFTGGSETGRQIAAKSSGNLKRLSMELGGKAPIVVLEDADLQAVASRLRFASFVNTGQACTAACRVLVHEDVYDQFLEIFIAEVKSIKVGDAAVEPGVDMGPMISAEHRQRVLDMLGRTGGKTLLGGGVIDRPGFFLEPTIVTDLDQQDELIQHEIFGPVVTVQKISSVEQAITFANDVPYGLSASVWTRDIKKALQVMRRLDFGQVWINDHLSSVSELPNGGFKQSGYGTDSSIDAIRHYTRTKHVWMTVD